MINRLYGDGITSYTSEDEDDMLVEKDCAKSNWNQVEDGMDAQACLSWG